MSYKDHLPTQTEHSRRQYRQIKQNQQTAYIAAPPAITETITDTGSTITPPTATQDLLNPLLGDIEDLSDNVATTLNIELDKITGTFHRIQLPDVGAITVNFIGLVKNKAEQMFLDFTKENVANTPTVTFVPPIFGLTQADLDAENRITVSVMARDTEDEVRLDVIGATGGGGITRPITVPVDSRGNVNTTQNIDFSITTSQSTKMTLTGDIAITFSNIPPNNTQLEWEIEIKQDSGGGNDVTSWPAAVINPPTINQAGGSTTLVVFRVNDGGTIINTLFSTIGVIVDVSQWATFPAVQDINFQTVDAINIDRLRFVSDSGAVASAGDPSILLDGSSNMIFNIADQKQWFWTNQNETIMQLNREGVNDDTVLTIETDSTDASAVPRIDIFRDDPSPVIDDEFGRIRFIGTDLALASQVYSQIAVEYESVTTGRIASSMIFVTSFDTGVTTQFKPFMAINTANDERIRMIEDVEIVQDLILQPGFTTSRLFFDLSGDTFLTGSSSDDRINVMNNGNNISYFDNGGFVTTQRLLMSETADPAAPTNAGYYYVKDVGGISRPFFIGDGLAAIDLTTGGAGDEISAGDSSVKVIDTGTGRVDIFIDSLATAKYSFDAADFSPVVAGGVNLGTVTLPWEKFNVKDIEIRTGGSLTINVNNIVADANGTMINTPTGDTLKHTINGVDNIIFDEDEIRFSSGRAHSIQATPTTLQIISELETDTVEIWNGGGRTNATIQINDTTTTWLTETDDIQAVLLQLIQNHDTPADFRTLGNIDFMAENSVSVNQIYARISASSQDITDATEDGLLQLGVMSAGTLVSAIDMEGGSSDANGAKIGFYGEATIAQQVLAASPTAAQISTVLEALGLTKFS